MAKAETQYGIVKFFNKDKGFGFIIPNDNETNVFFHHSGLKDKNVKQDDQVSYTLGEGKRGIFAENVTIL
jgi:CspA family cold shock protein